MAFVPHNVLRSRFIFSLVSHTIGPWSQEDGWRIWSVVLGMFLWATPKVVYITSIQLQCLKLNYTASKTAKVREELSIHESRWKRNWLRTPSYFVTPPSHYSPLWRIYSSRSDQIPPLWKHFLTTPKGSENSLFLKFYNAYYLSCLFTCHSSIIVFLFDYACLSFFNGILSSLKIYLLGFSFIQNVLLDKYCIKT